MGRILAFENWIARMIQNASILISLLCIGFAFVHGRLALYQKDWGVPAILEFDAERFLLGLVIASLAGCIASAAYYLVSPKNRVFPICTTVIGPWWLSHGLISKPSELSATDRDVYSFIGVLALFYVLLAMAGLVYGLCRIGVLITKRALWSVKTARTLRADSESHPLLLAAILLFLCEHQQGMGLLYDLLELFGQRSRLDRRGATRDFAWHIVTVLPAILLNHFSRLRHSGCGAESSLIGGRPK